MDHEERKLREDSCVPLNEKAWNDLAYEAWCAKYGNPCEVALKIMKIPEKTIGVLLEEFGELKGKKVANLMGSHGMKALALARLGAEVTVIDFSEGNKRYAEELSGEMKTPIHYVLSNVTEVPDSELTGDYDIVFAEMGILHYFSDLTPF
jgi:2-polyprenyl-3-methyl-5-hydroxy-6-metoxy-1,4-benzoquinol methylase